MSNDARTQTEDAYLALQSTSEFQALRKKFRGFVFPMTAFFLAWYFLYVLLSMFAPEFMGQQVGGQASPSACSSAWPVRHDVRDHDHLRPLGQP